MLEANEDGLFPSEGEKGAPVMKQGICPICGSTRLREVLKGVKDYVTDVAFTVIHCDECEVDFTFPQPDNMEAFYPAKYRRYNKWVAAILTSMYRFQVNRWRRFYRKSGSAVELGCGDGLMLDALRRYGWRVAGTERTQEMADEVQKNLGFPVYVGGLEKIPAGEKFDLIILFQVLEHLNDPLGVLKQCTSLLREGGKLVIAVPNVRSWQARYSSGYWFHLDVPRHLFHFSGISLRNALNLAGLQLQGISFISFEHDPYGWVQSILNRHFDNKNKLTRYLMHLDPLTLGRVSDLLLSLILIGPAMVLSAVSWVFGNGAIMQAVSSLRDEVYRGSPRKESHDV